MSRYFAFNKPGKWSIKYTLKMRINKHISKEQKKNQKFHLLLFSPSIIANDTCAVQRNVCSSVPISRVFSGIVHNTFQLSLFMVKAF